MRYNIEGKHVVKIPKVVKRDKHSHIYCNAEDSINDIHDKTLKKYRYEISEDVTFTTQFLEGTDMPIKLEKGDMYEYQGLVYPIVEVKYDGSGKGVCLINYIISEKVDQEKKNEAEKLLNEITERLNVLIKKDINNIHDEAISLRRAGFDVKVGHRLDMKQKSIYVYFGEKLVYEEDVTLNWFDNLLKVSLEDKTERKRQEIYDYWLHKYNEKRHREDC